VTEEQNFEQHVSTDIGAFAMVPLWYLETHPSGRAVHCLSVLLAKFADRLMGCSASTVDRALEELKEAGIVSTSGRVREDGSQTSNAYIIRLARPTPASLVPQNCSTASSDLHNRSSRFDQPITRTSEPESSNKKRSALPPRTEVTDEWKEAIRGEWSPQLRDFDEAYDFILNSNYLSGLRDKQSYVLKRLKGRAAMEAGWAKEDRIKGSGQAASGQKLPPTRLNKPQDNSWMDAETRERMAKGLPLEVTS